MYTGTNPAALRSMRLLRNAFTSLLSRNSYESISVQQICVASQVSRRTFYNLFDDKEDIARYSVRKTLEKSASAVEGSKNSSAASSAERYGNFIHDCAPTLKQYIDSGLETVLQEELKKLYSEYPEKLSQDNPKKLETSEIDYLAGAYSLVTVYWLNDTNPDGKFELLFGGLEAYSGVSNH